MSLQTFRLLTQSLAFPTLSVYLHDDALRSGDTLAVLEELLVEGDGTVANAKDARADLHGAGPGDLPPEGQLKGSDHKIGLSQDGFHFIEIEELYPAGFQEGGENGIVDMTLPISVGIAELVVGLLGEIGEGKV